MGFVRHHASQVGLQEASYQANSVQDSVLVDQIHQNGVQKGHLKCPKAYIFLFIFACYFRHVFDVVLGSKMNRKWVQKGVQNVTENHEKSTPAPECDFGAIWGLFWTDFGQIWGRFLIDFSLIFDRILIDFHTIFCTHFSASKTTLSEKLAKTHEPVAAKKHPAFQKNALSVPPAC